MVVVFVDILGVRSRWHLGGRESAEKAFARLRALVTEALRNVGATSIETGGIETDSAALVFSSATSAAVFVRTLFRFAFEKWSQQPEERMWLRGVVTSSEPGLLRRESVLAGFERVRLYDLETGLLDAIAVEKSGFKGMRVVIENQLVNDALRRDFRIHIKNQTFFPFRKLRHSAYPARIAEEYQDFLWMVKESRDEWEEAKRTMSHRLRTCARNPEEFLQAGATQVVFNEADEIIRSLDRRSDVR